MTKNTASEVTNGLAYYTVTWKTLWIEGVARVFLNWQVVVSEMLKPQWLWQVAECCSTK